MNPLASTGRRAALVVMSAALSACASGLNALKPSSTFAFTEGVSYGPNPRQTLDIYRPSSKAPPGGWPVVVFFYGGSWHWGNRAEYTFAGEALASRGVLTLIADYRLYPEVKYPDFLDDSAMATSYALREALKLGGNPERVYVMGHSAGAYNAAMVALDDRWLKAQGQSPAALAGWIGLAGPYEFLPITNPQAQVVFHHPDYPPGTQPIAYVRRSSPRAFLGAAHNDQLVSPVRNTEQMAERLKAAGVPVQVKLYDGVNHVTLVASMAWSLRWMSTVLDDVSAFMHTDTKATTVAASPAP
ncbi:MAG: alpha/beta hydrolase [Rhizobacter sp.]